MVGVLPPGPRPFPVIGNLLELGDQPHQSLTKLAKTYGPIMRLKLGSMTTMGLLAHVRKCSESGALVNLGEVIFTASLNLLANAMLSIDLADPTSETAKKFKAVVWQIMVAEGTPNMADYFPMLKKIDPQGAKRSNTDCITHMFDVFDRVIDKRLQDRKVPGAVRKNDLLDVLLDLSEDDSKDTSIFHIKHLFLDLLVAGTEATASTMEWAMAELLHCPEKLVKVQAELELVIGRDNPIKESDVARLPYLQAMVKETYRMHPPLPLVPRMAGANVQVSGYTIPEGAQILVNVWAIGKDPTLWKNPDKFIPERFLGLDIDVKGQNFELLPFGGGRRICPALPLASRMIHLMLGSLLNSFDWKLEDGISPDTMDMGENYGLTLRRAQSLLAVPLPIKKQ
ncbi:hypothetical protein CDL15_Pgr017794 [Punica granatum]|uniref:Geraniol 8-hydroxylase-like n=1 Tax=Punica granatum TaxID=22663 RepID=A0A218WI58_PUNGR|nr:hypothetical protein CDL15_Pgr017794 [Punica granatum]